MEETYPPSMGKVWYLTLSKFDSILEKKFGGNPSWRFSRLVAVNRPEPKKVKA